MLFKGKQITCLVNYESEKYSFDLDKHKTLNDLYIMFQEKIQSKECYFIILFILLLIIKREGPCFIALNQH